MTQHKKCTLSSLLVPPRASAQNDRQFRPHRIRARQLAQRSAHGTGLRLTEGRRFYAGGAPDASGRAGRPYNAPADFQRGIIALSAAARAQTVLRAAASIAHYAPAAAMARKLHNARHLDNFAAEYAGALCPGPLASGAPFLNPFDRLARGFSPTRRAK